MRELRNKNIRYRKNLKNERIDRSKIMKKRENSKSIDQKKLKRRVNREIDIIEENERSKESKKEDRSKIIDKNMRYRGLKKNEFIE